VNVVDNPGLSTFILPSVLDRSPAAGSIFHWRCIAGARKDIAQQTGNADPARLWPPSRVFCAVSAIRQGACCRPDHAANFWKRTGRCGCRKSAGGDETGAEIMLLGMLENARLPEMKGRTNR